MHLMVGLQSAWKCVEISLQDGSVPVIGGVPLPDCNIEPAVWFKALVLDSVCIDCSDHVISWAVGSPSSSLSHHQSTPTTSSPDHTLMAPHEDGEPSCPDNLHDLFEVAETLFRASPLCSPSHHHYPSSHPPSPHREDWEHQMWLRLLHTLLLPLLTLQREDLPSLQLSLDNYCNHTIASLDSNISQSTALSQQLKEELDTVRSSLLPLVVSSPTHPHPPLLLSLLNTDLKQMEDDARSKIAYYSRTLALQSRLTASGSPVMNLDKLQADKKLVESHLTTSMEMKSVVLSLTCQSVEDHLQPVSGDLPELTRRYLGLQERLREARASANHWSRKKVLALSVREAMEQAVASLQVGHVTAGMDISMHGGRSTDVLPEASHYQAKEEFTTLSERVKQLLMAHSPAARLHNSLVQTVQMKWFPAMCNGFVVISSDMTRTLPSPRTRTQSWRRHFSFKKTRTMTAPSSPPPSNMAQAGKLLHIRFQEIVSALCDHLADHDTGFTQQVWLCYENLFFDNFSSSFLSHYQNENQKFCEQLRVNALSVSVLPPSSLSLTIPETAWLSLFPPRSFSDATLLYSQPLEDPDVTSEPPQLAPGLQAKFGPVVTDLYCMAGARAPLHKLQLLTSAFRKTMASLSALKLQSLLEEGSTDFHLAGVSCDDLLPLLVLLLLQLPPAFLCQLWLHCLLLEDCCPSFLQAGWHGYSLTTFRSSLTVISEL